MLHVAALFKFNTPVDLINMTAVSLHYGLLLYVCEHNIYYSDSRWLSPYIYVLIVLVEMLLKT